MATLNENICEIIRRKRKVFRYTQDDLGNRIVRSGSYISAIEGNKTSPTIEELEKLAAAFRTTALDIIEEAASLESRVFRAKKPSEGDTLLTVIEGLSPERQQMAREFLLFLQDRQASEG
jgi:transcriptional regulator with XRE-family HTH domain